jgi:hypothetical protein
VDSLSILLLELRYISASPPLQSQALHFKFI